ncbi:MAG: glycosyltransferase family 39 protein, partial [Saprospiraceae bacterium]|nr:glycosyltransferase family 39 protein [Saprospiraceae bacterium]
MNRVSVQSFLRNWGWLAGLIVVKLVLQLLAAGQYGFHRDEFLYLVQGHHPAWGYMEVPPMIAWLAAFIQFFGEGIVWIKLFPALAGSVSLILIALMTRDLGGARWAQIVACLGFLFVPAYLRTHHLFQPVFLNQLFWLLSIFFLIRIYKTGDTRYWYMFGVAIGLGILTKYSILFLGIAMLAGILFTRERRWLARPHPYYAMLLAILIASPNILWQYFHNVPVLAHMEELRATQLVHVEPVGFVTSQLLMLFGASLLWFPGLAAFLGGASFRPFRALGWTYLVLLALLLLLSGKAYYMLGIYPPLIAAGAVWWERRAVRLRGVKTALPVIVVVLNLFALPYGLPILPVDTM